MRAMMVDFFVKNPSSVEQFVFGKKEPNCSRGENARDCGGLFCPKGPYLRGFFSLESTWMQ